MFKKIKLFLMIIFIIGFISTISLTIFFIRKAYEGLPDVSKLVEDYTPIIPTKIYDINGDIIDIIYKENREIAKIDEIPIYARKAFMAVEDKRFESHYGFDPIRLSKAMLVNIIEMRKSQGGSTITQQLAKNAFLTNEKKIIRKVKEAIITIEIEKKYTKDEIIEKYLNEIYFGSGAYGIKTAAKLFFNKEIKDINIAEAALLAGVPNRPSKYSPLKNLKEAEKRQKLILFLMKNAKFITEEEYNEAKNYKLEIAKIGERIYKAPDFTNIVVEKIFKDYGEDAIYEGGYSIYTTLDLKMQKEAKSAFSESAYLKKYKTLEGALVCMDSNTGYIKAIVGGRDYKKGNFNRAIMAKRQPGSSFKPFIYYTAIKQNYQMNLVIEDSKLKTKDGWSPGNYNGKFTGNNTILKGLENSVNTVAAKLLRKVGVKNAIKTARDAGITSSIPNNLTIALGTNDLTPIELTTAYAPFSNGGYSVEPIFITKILDRYGNTIFENQIKKKKVFEPENIALIVHMMKNVVMNGSGKGARVKYNGKFIEQGGKTGTTNRFTNAWFSGVTSDLTCTLYIGNDNNKPMKRGMAGGTVAAPIWGSFVQKLVDKGIYHPSKFDFLENEIKDKKIVYKSINPVNGFLSLKSGNREALFKRGFLPVEEDKKYEKGLDVFFEKNKEEKLSKVESKKTNININENKFNKKIEEKREIISEKEANKIVDDILKDIM